MQRKIVFYVFLLFIVFGCVDRVFFDIHIPDEYGISISGFISDQPGPYQVNVFRSFDTESSDNPKTGVSAKSVVISDTDGNHETLTQVRSGVYATAPQGIRGRAGGVYRVTVELDDGRVFESTPDTLRAGGLVDSVYYVLTSHPDVDGVQYEFDIYANTSATTESRDVHFMWVNRTTFQSTTKPELEPNNCYRIPSEGRCNYINPCTGIKNIGSDFQPMLVRVGPCECCTCWYDAYNSKILLNDKIGSVNGSFPTVMVDRVPMNGYYMMYKMRIEVSMQTLSTQSYRCWKAVRDQYSAVTNIFQPIIGKIPGNIVQTVGEGQPPVGLFYATSMASKNFWIHREDVPKEIIPSTNVVGQGLFSCFQLFPNASNRPPSFWDE